MPGSAEAVVANGQVSSVSSTTPSTSLTCGSKPWRSITARRASTGSAAADAVTRLLSAPARRPTSSALSPLRTISDSRSDRRS